MADSLSELLDSEQFRRFVSRRGTSVDEVELRQMARRAGLESADLDRLRVTAEKGEAWRLVAAKTGLDPELIWKRSQSQSPPIGSPPPSAIPLSVVASELPRRRVILWGAGVAAALMLALGSALAFRDAKSARSTPMQVVATQPGQRIQYRLPDGSRVMLAPESKLRILEWNVSGARDVELEGLAYFDVEHDGTRPFRVHITNATVEDLGTEFVVRAYPQERVRSVAVRSGLVAVHRHAAPTLDRTTLEPGDVAQLDASGFATKISADTSLLLGWVEGQLIFRDAPVSDVLRQLRRWYGVAILASDSALLSTQLTLAVTERNTPAEAIAYVASLANARVDYHDGIYALRRQ